LVLLLQDHVIKFFFQFIDQTSFFRFRSSLFMLHELCSSLLKHLLSYCGLFNNKTAIDEKVILAMHRAFACLCICNSSVTDGFRQVDKSNASSLSKGLFTVLNIFSTTK